MATEPAQVRMGLPWKTTTLSVEKHILALPRLLFIIFFAAVLASCTAGPKTYSKTVTRAATDTHGTFLARRADALGDPHDGRSGVYLVSDGPEALALRLVLSEKAQRTIDAQYYLLHNDASGHLFTWQLLQAADRGVRVRLLLDDMDVAGYDRFTAALDQHPNFEIRLFNPFRRGFGRNLASLFEFKRVNRRMHNKSMTFDNVVTLVGGRNIGDEYFAAREDSNYNDLDVMGIGPIAKEVSSSFDGYWNSPFAVPVSAVVQERKQDVTLAQARQRLAELAETARRSPFGEALAHGIRDRVTSRGLDLSWVPAKLIADPPQKAAGVADTQSYVAAQMQPYLERAERDLFVSSAYFVPRRRGVEFLTEMRRRGVQISILTNSLDSTDVVPVYGHYALSRKDMLAAGIELWELRPDTTREDRDRLGLGLSQSSLHTKAFAIDRRYLFVGSFNWDPRSVRINNEMGVLIESERLTDAAVRKFQRNLEQNAYKLRLNDDGKIEWLAQRENGVLLLYRHEPIVSPWRAFMSRFYGVLPIGSQL